MPLITVALPVFNGEQYLESAINSILNQTISDFEFIIIDDGSTDNSLELIQRFAKLDKRIILISQKNKNLATTLNDIAHLAKGKWYARMDQDDIALPNRFEKQLNWLNQNNADICGSWVQLFGTHDKRILKHPESDEAVKVELMFGTCFAHPSVMMKTDLVKSLRYDKAWEKCEDYDLWERLARAGWKMGNVPEVLLMYRQHPTQISSVTSSKQQELTQKIRQRYGYLIFERMGLPKFWFNEILKLRDSSLGEPDMNIVDLSFDHILKMNVGEAREVIFDHMTRLYFRAGEQSNIANRWLKLNHIYGSNLGIRKFIQLQIVSFFNLTPQNILWQKMKIIYLFLVR